MQRRDVLVSELTGTPEFMDWTALVEHRECVQAGLTVEEINNRFRDHAEEFAAVVDGEAYIGLVSRGQLGILLGTRFGFTLHSRHPIREHMLPASLTADPAMPLMDLLERALSRQGEAFYHDVPLVDQVGRFLGIIPVPSLVRAQSSVISEQFTLVERQRQELLTKNHDLFRSVHQLRQSQGRYQTLFQNSPLAVGLLHRDGRIETGNDKLELLTASLPQTGQLPNLASAIPSQHRQAFLDLLRLQEAGTELSRPQAQEFPLTLPGQGDRVFEFYTSLVQETGQICTILHDVTDQRVAQRKLTLGDKAAMMESLVGGIAHELNNKLSPVLGYAELLSLQLAKGVDPEAMASHCRTIAQNAQECVRIIRQLLQLSRPAAMALQPVDLKGILEEAASIMQFRLKGVQADLRLLLPEGGLVIQADGAQIKQVLVNLMLNGVDAMDHALRRTLEVRAEATSEGWATIAVKDTGHGIPPDMISRIFDPFYSTKAPEKGTGLGLSVCLGIIRQHGGEISVNSVPGEGTEFVVQLPRAPKHAKVLGAPTRPWPEAPLPVPGAQSRRLEVLIVDDEDYITSLVQELLRSLMGWQVERAHDGQEAIQRMESTPFDLVITDLRMPGVDGYALLNWIRAYRPEMYPKVLVITGDTGSQAMEQELQSLGVPALRKPFTPQALLDQCCRLLGLAQPDPSMSPA
jgi:signal transduction histidine kinase